MCLIAAAPAAGAAAAGVSTGAMTAMMVASLAATAMSTVGSFMQQDAANKQAKYQAGIARNNAIAAKYEGEYAKEQSEEKAKQHRKMLSAFKGEQRAAQGGSGIVVDEGSFFDTTLDTVEQGKLDELAILHEGDKAVWQSEVQAQNYTSQANLYEMSQSSPFLAGGMQLMTGLGNLGTNYAMMKIR